MEDCQFHQCVQLGRFDANRIISFVPPDGEFELMRYRAVENINLPFKVIPQVTEIGQHKVEYVISVKANFGTKLFATDVSVNIPTPLNTSKTAQSTSSGKAKYDPSENQIVWKISHSQGIHFPWRRRVNVHHYGQQGVVLTTNFYELHIVNVYKLGNCGTVSENL